MPDTPVKNPPPSERLTDRLPEPDAALSPEELAERIRADQRDGLARGELTPAEDYLRRFTSLAADEAWAVDVIFNEFLLCERSGEASPEEFIARFPQYADALARQFDVHRAMAGLELTRLREATPLQTADGAPKTELRNDPVPPAPPAAGQIRKFGRYEVRTVGRFEIRKQLGSGGFGTVYRAFDPQLGRDVALKIPHPHLVDDQYRERFLREARAAAHLQHPNIVAVFDFGATPEAWYIAFQLVEGRSLAKLLRKRRLTARESAQLVRKLALAAHHAHAKGVFHRDLKTANVLVVESAAGELEPMIADFGLVRLEGDSTLTATVTVLGTPAYMSPEQASGASHLADARSDTYTLGVVLYELLTGQLPFSGAPHSVLRQVVEQEPARPRSVNASIPRDLETICLKAMAKQPDRRYPSAQHLADDLERWLAGEPIQARPTGAAERLLLWSRRQPKLAAAFAIAAVSLVAGTISSTMFAFRARHEAAVARADKRTADKRLYLSDMRLVEQAWQEDRPDFMADLLDGQRPERTGGVDLRGFEWYYWNNVLHSDISTIACERNLHAVAFSPDGSRLATGGRAVQVWDATSRRELFKLPIHVEGNRGLAYSSDGSSLAVAGVDGVARMFDASRGTTLREIAVHADAIRVVSLSPDDRLLVTDGPDGTIHVWELETGEEKLALSGHAGGTRDAQFTPDRSFIVSGGVDQNVRVWEAGTGRLVRTLEGHKNCVNVICFGPDNRLVSADAAGYLRFWDLTTGSELLARKAHRDHVGGLASSADGRLIATGSTDGLVKLWDARTGDPVRTIKGHLGYVYGVAFSPDTSRLASTEESEVKIWAVENDPEARIWRASGAEVCSVAFSPDGQSLATGDADGAARLWDVATRREEHALWGHGASLYGVAFSADGRRLATASKDWTVRIWDAVTGDDEPMLAGHTDAVWDAAFNRDGTRLATAGEDKTVRIWDLATRRQAMVFEMKERVGSVAFSPDGLRVAAACWTSEDNAKVWDAETGTELLNLAGHGQAVWCIIFSQDGRYLATSSNDQTIRIWSAATGRLIQTMRGHNAQVSRIAFNPDATRIASASWDNTVKVWDIETGRALLTLSSSVGRFFSVAFSPDGRLLAAGRQDGTVLIWDGRPRQASEGRSTGDR